jgi:hypothetical protein
MNKWISVSDRLPKENVEVLTCSSAHQLYVCVYRCGNWLSYNEFHYYIAYWMPIPRLPK